MLFIFRLSAATLKGLFKILMHAAKQSFSLKHWHSEVFLMIVDSLTHLLPHFETDGDDITNVKSNTMKIIKTFFTMQKRHRYVVQCNIDTLFFCE